MMVCKVVHKTLWYKVKDFLMYDTGLGEENKCFIHYPCKHISNNRKYDSYRLHSVTKHMAFVISFLPLYTPHALCLQQAHQPADCSYYRGVTQTFSLEGTRALTAMCRLGYCSFLLTWIRRCDNNKAMTDILSLTSVWNRSQTFP